MSRPLEQHPAGSDRYQAQRRLGEGAFGEVYLCHDAELDRPVALKVLHLKGVSGPRSEEILSRFQVEARVAARLSHPGLVDLYDHGVLPDGRAYLVWEYVEGRPLEDELEPEVPLEPARAVAWIRELAEALDHAHKQGVLHRDLKPANILVRDGHVVLCDFGLARDNTSAEALTATGAVLGTPQYLAPEVMRGDAEAGPALDVWGLAAIAYEMLYGRPYRRTSTDLLEDSRDRGPPTRERLGRYPDLDPALAWGLYGDPEKRAPGALAFAEALEGSRPVPAEIRNSLPGAAPSPPEPPGDSSQAAMRQPPPVRGPRPWPWGGLLVAAIAAGVLIGLGSPDPEPVVPSSPQAVAPRWDPEPLRVAREELWRDLPDVDGLETQAVQRGVVLVQLGVIDDFQAFMDRYLEAVEALDRGEVAASPEALAAAAHALLQQGRRLSKTEEHVRGGLLSAALDGRAPGFSLPEWERAFAEYRDRGQAFVQRLTASPGRVSHDARVAALIAVGPVLAPREFLRLGLEVARRLPATSGPLAEVQADGWAWAARWDEWSKSGITRPRVQLLEALLDALEEAGGRWPGDELRTPGVVAHCLARSSWQTSFQPALRVRLRRAFRVLEEQVWEGRERDPEPLRRLHAEIRDDLPDDPAEAREIRELLARRAADAR